MEKNRISAKRSREKQKKKLEDLESLTEQLKAENMRLYDQNEKQNQLLQSFHNYFCNKICSSCTNKLPSDLSKLIGRKTNNVSTDEEGSLLISSSNNSGHFSMNPFAKFSIFAGILMIVCLVGNMMTIHFKKENNEPSARRNLSQINRYTNFADEEYNTNLNNIDNIKKINQAISNQIELAEPKKIYFNTYKDLSNRNEASLVKLENEQNKEILE